VWYIGLPPTRDGYVCKPLDLKANGASCFYSWICIGVTCMVWFEWSHSYTIWLCEGNGFWIILKQLFQSNNFIWFHWKIIVMVFCWWCSGKCRAWCECWYMEPGCFVLWIFIWCSSIWGQGTLRHIQKVSMNWRNERKWRKLQNIPSFRIHKYLSNLKAMKGPKCFSFFILITC